MLAQLESSVGPHRPPYDSGVLADGTPFFVWKYVRRRADHRLLAHQASCSLEGSCDSSPRFARRCIAARARSHHRDIKPSNVLVKRDGSLRLLGLRIAKQFGERGRIGEPDPDRISGSCARYAHPSSFARPGRDPDPTIYSLGGRALSTSLPAAALRNLARRSRRAGAEKLWSNVNRQAFPGRRGHDGGGLTDSPAGADPRRPRPYAPMHKDPQRRYRSADALIRDIDHFLKSQPSRHGRHRPLPVEQVLVAAIGAASPRGRGARARHRPGVFFTHRGAAHRAAREAEPAGASSARSMPSSTCARGGRSAQRMGSRCRGRPVRASARDDAQIAAGDPDAL